MQIRETVVTVGALRFPVREAGPTDGFPVVLLHGFPCDRGGRFCDPQAVHYGCEV